MFCGGNIDWAATGTMLQGIGTIVGAIAVIVAALVGGNTFTAWRRQQLVQKHMALAERIMTGAFNAKEIIEAARSPLMAGHELDAAEKYLDDNGIAVGAMEKARGDRYRTAQARLTRINRHSETWKNLQESKASAYAYFGGDLPKDIDRILKLVSDFRLDAEEYAGDDGSDKAFTNKLRSTLTSSRVRGDKDEFAAELDAAIAAIEERLKPFLQEVAVETQKVLKAIIEKSLSIYGIPLRL